VEQVFGIFGAGERRRVHRRGHPESWHRTDIDTMKARGGNTDHRHGVLVDEDLAAGDIRCPAKLSLPEIVG
jgi:hypothetical protein